MNKYYKNWFLLNLIIFSLIGSHFINGELNNPEMMTNSHSTKDEKTVCSNKSFKEVLIDIPWKKIAFRYAVFFAVMGTFYHGFKTYREWSSERSLSKIEQELLWHDTILSFLVANVIVGDLIYCSPKDKKSCEKQNSIEGVAC